jgi:hypothetical protein
MYTPPREVSSIIVVTLSLGAAWYFSKQYLEVVKAGVRALEATARATEAVAVLQAREQGHNVRGIEEVLIFLILF